MEARKPSGAASATTSRESNPVRGISWQQVPVIAAIDRSGRKFERAIGYRDDVADALLEGIGNGSILCTDGWSGFRRVVQASQSWHVVVRSPVKAGEEASEDRPKFCNSIPREES